MTVMPIYDKKKTFKNLLLQNQLTDGLETGYVALGNPVPRQFYKLCL